jgi:dTDP-4-amino-4,6-dideoxygalactose transaminase
MSNQPAQEIPLLNLQRQYEPLYPELQTSFEAFLRSGQFILGPDLRSLETELADYLGVQHALGVSNGTDGLLISLLAAGVGKGDKVLTTPFTFFATVSAILGVGAEPVFADIDEKTYCLDPKLAEEALRKDKKIKAVILVHLYGQPGDVKAFESLKKNYNVAVIEDAAQAIGAESEGKKVGGFGDLAAFSFYPTKNLGAIGDAGLVTTNNSELYEKITMLRVHGQRQRTYSHERVGGNYRMDTLQALCLRKFLPHLDGWNASRRTLAEKYTESLKPVSDLISPPKPEKNTVHTYHQYTVRVKKGLRDNLKSYLAENKIASCVYYPIPCHKQTALTGLVDSNASYPLAEKAANEVLSLPVFPTLLNQEQERIIETLVSWAKRNA